jgi:hypothetical protein
MIRFHAAALIERPVEDVFEYVADVNNMPLWYKGVLGAEQLAPGPVHVGAQYRVLRRVRREQAENTFEVYRYEPAEKFAIKTISGPAPCEYRFEFNPGGLSTRLGVAAEIESKGLANLLAKVRLRRIQEGAKQLEESLDALKGLLESKT